MTDNSQKTHELLKAYFSREIKELSFDSNTKHKSKRVVSIAVLVASFCLCLILSVIFSSKEPVSPKAIYQDGEVMIYVSDNNVALANSNSSGFKLPQGDNEEPYRISLIHCDRQDLLYYKTEAESEYGSFVFCSDDVLKAHSIEPDLQIVNPAPEKEPNENVINDEELRYEMSPPYGHEAIAYNDRSFVLGYYNEERLDDIITLTIIYVDGSTSKHYIKADYIEGAPIENELELTLISSEYY